MRGIETLGQRLREERKRRAETQTVAAQRFGITQPSYGRWEADRMTPADHHLERIAEYVGTDVAAVWQLVHGDPEPTAVSDLREQIDLLRADIELVEHSIIGDT